MLLMSVIPAAVAPHCNMGHLAVWGV